MSCKIAVYSPEDVKVLIGVSAVDGFDIDDVVSITKVNEVYTQKINSDGSVSRTHKGDNVFNVAISLSAASEWNQILTHLVTVDRLTQMGKFPVFIKDQQGESLFTSPTSWVEKIPDTDYTTSIGTRHWLLCCSHGVLNLGGNYEQSSFAKDVLNGIAGGSNVLGGLL